MGPIIFWLQNFRQMRYLVIFISMGPIRAMFFASKMAARAFSRYCKAQCCRHVVRSSFALIISSRDCREADSRDTSPRHACLGEVSRKIWLHDFAINNNGGSVPVIFISLIGTNFGISPPCFWLQSWRRALPPDIVKLSAPVISLFCA